MLYEQITLALLKVRGIGPRTVHHLWKQFPKMTCHADVIEALRNTKFASSNIADFEQNVRDNFAVANRMLEQCIEDGVKIISPKDFPPQLKSIPNPPLLLFLLGNNEALMQKAIAVVGTREPTDFGARSAKKIAQSLAEQNWTVVSGLAEGCDTAGHEGCLAGRGQTVAVLAHGFGRIYPAVNKDLAHRILLCGGCLLTEYPPGQPPSRSSFIERDRLQSGASHGLIVVETDVKGGTMHTVRHATEQARPIGAICHPDRYSNEAKAQGNKLLISQGAAMPLRDRNDVFAFVNSTQATNPEAHQNEPNEEKDFKLDGSSNF